MTTKPASWPEAADVCIVGAGPVGSFLACLLHASGASVHIIEARDQPPEGSMAIGIMPPTLRRLAAIGMAEAVVAAGCLVRHAVIHSARRELGRLTFARLPPPYPFILTLPQATLMQLLWQRMRTLCGVTFDTGTRAESIIHSQNQNSVQVQTRHNGAGRVLNCRFAVVCDGAHGVLRNELGLASPTRHYRQTFVMGNAPDHTGWNQEAHIFFTSTGSLEAFPLPAGHRRWVAQIMPGENGGSDASQLCRQVKAIANVHLVKQDLREVTRFTPSHRLAPRYHTDRIALCGDAAHVMSPIGGQGMNVGLADAWHLAAVWARSQRETGTLDRLSKNYTARRRRAFRVAARRAALGMHFGTGRGRWFSALRAGLIRHLLLRPPLSFCLARTFSMWTMPDGEWGPTSHPTHPGGREATGTQSDGS